MCINTLLSCMGKKVSYYIIYQRYSLVLREIIISTERTVNVVFPYQLDDPIYTNVYLSFLISIRNKK